MDEQISSGIFPEEICDEGEDTIGHPYKDFEHH